VEEPAANSVAFRPSARKILVEIERGTRLEHGALPIRKIIQFHPFGDRSASDPDLGGNVSESPAGGVHPLGVHEQSLSGVAPLTPNHFMSIADDSRKSGSAGRPTDGCHFPLDILAKILQQMETIGDLLRGTPPRGAAL